MTADSTKMISLKTASSSTFAWIFVFANVFYISAQVIELTPVPCDDKSVEKLARLAITYINEDRQTGYKFALNRITNVQLHAQGPAGKVYYLDADVLETKCHVKSPKTWKRCDVRPFMETQISGNCNITLLHDAGGYSYLYSYDCTLVPDPPEKLQKTCPVCPLLLQVDSREALGASLFSLNKYKAQSTLPVSLALHTITRASAQREPFQRTFVEFTIAECGEGVTASGFCEPVDAERKPIGFCAGAVVGNNWFQQDAKVSCEIFHPQRFGSSAKVNVKPVVHDVAPTVATEPGAGIDAVVPEVPGPNSNPYTPIQPPVGPDDRLFDPIHHAPVPYDPMAVSPHVAASSSESESSESQSSEELGVTIARPPADFRYKPHRRKRRALFGTKPPHTPVFLAVFPSGGSPFRSCPGVPRYTTL
ncbi:fetuin-B [Alosa pseudoharengus]|uniref:fetuin-B n=1 Tax=Alosa pseudoharengus TaxID=34774 RepID=UPI003F8BF278